MNICALGHKAKAKQYSLILTNDYIILDGGINMNKTFSSSIIGMKSVQMAWNSPTGAAIMATNKSGNSVMRNLFSKAIDY